MSKTVTDALRAAAGKPQITFDDLRNVVEAIIADTGEREGKFVAQIEEIRSAIRTTQKIIETELPDDPGGVIVGPTALNPAWLRHVDPPVNVIPPNINERD